MIAEYSTRTFCEYSTRTFSERTPLRRPIPHFSTKKVLGAEYSTASTEYEREREREREV
jgi:hypothetical protein